MAFLGNRIRLCHLTLYLLLLLKCECNEELHFSILPDGSITLQIFEGVYANEGQFCYLQFGVENAEKMFEFIDVSDCPSSISSDVTKCVIDCAQPNYSIPYNILLTKLKYIRIISGSDSDALLLLEGERHTFSLKRVIENTQLPEVKIDTYSDGQLCIKIKTCLAKKCTVNYGNYVINIYETLNACDNFYGNCIKFNNFLPHYEVNCQNLPPIMYNNVNKYTDNFETSKLQFYFQKTTEENAVHLKFQNSMRGEICMFKYKQGVGVEDVDDSTCAYQSNCGNTDGCCYSMCDDVFVNLDSPSGNYLKVVIYNRFTRGTIDEGEICTKCLTQDKHTTNKADLIFSSDIITDITETGFQLNADLFKQNPDNLIVKCNMKYMKADQPLPDVLEDLKCSSLEKCDIECTTLVAEGMVSGTSYLIRMFDHEVANVPGVRFDYFVVTKPTTQTDSGNFYDTSGSPDPTYTGFLVGLRTANIEGKDINEIPSCRYYVSLAGKDAFYLALCEGQMPCMGLCTEALTIIGLNKGESYDIKVNSNKYLGSYYHRNLKTLSVESNISHSFEGTQLNIVATLTTEEQTLSANCEWTIYNMANDERAEIASCTVVGGCSPLPDCGLITIENTDPAGSYEVFIRVPKLDEELIHVIQTIASVEPDDGTVMCTIKLLFKDDTSEEYVQAKECDSTEDNSCISPQKCANIVIKDVQSLKSYKVIVSIAETKVFSEVFIKTDSSIDPQFSHEYKENQLVITRKLPAEMESSKCTWNLKIKKDETFEDYMKCDSENTEHCTELPLCTSIIIENVDPQQDYRIEIKAVGDENSLYYNIAKTPIEGVSFKIYYMIYGNSLKVSTRAESPTTQKFRCSWILEQLNPDETYTVLKKCVEDNLEICGKYPRCDKISIDEVDKTQSYRLTVSYVGQPDTSKIIDITPGIEKGLLKLPHTMSGAQITINTKILPFIEDAKCCWKLESQKEDGVFTVDKECSSELLQDCSELPPCKNLIITELTGEIMYRVTVSVSGSSIAKSFTIMGASSNISDPNEKSTTVESSGSGGLGLSLNTVYIIAGVSGAVLIAVIVGVVLLIRRNRTNHNDEGLVMSDEY